MPSKKPELPGTKRPHPASARASFVFHLLIVPCLTLSFSSERGWQRALNSSARLRENVQVRVYYHPQRLADRHLLLDSPKRPKQEAIYFALEGHSYNNEQIIPDHQIKRGICLWRRHSRLPEIGFQEEWASLAVVSKYLDRSIDAVYVAVRQPPRQSCQS